MLAGEAACQDAARLRHIERIECPQHGDVQEMVAAIRDYLKRNEKKHGNK